MWLYTFYCVNIKTLPYVRSNDCLAVVAKIVLLALKENDSY